MNVLVAKNELQGATSGDYAHTVEGELVLVDLVVCDSPSRCGCGRGWLGMASRRATTTAMIIDLPHVSESDLRQAIADWLDASGWTDLLRNADGEALTDGDGDEMFESIVDEHVESIAAVCESFPIGSVLERNGNLVRLREWPAAA